MKDRIVVGQWWSCCLAYNCCNAVMVEAIGMLKTVCQCWSQQIGNAHVRFNFNVSICHCPLKLHTHFTHLVAKDFDELRHTLASRH